MTFANSMQEGEQAPPAGGEEVLEIPAGFGRLRVDKALAALRPDLSRSRWQQLLAAGRVWRDDGALTKSDRVGAGEEIVFSVPPPRPLALRPVPMPLEILHEEAEWLALNKRPGVVVHPGAGTGEDTLVHGLLHHCAGALSGIGGAERPGIVHRLDKETSGVLLVAKSDRAYQALALQFAERSLEKIYWAVVRGRPAAAAGEIAAAIGRHPVQRMRMAVRPDGRAARSCWRVLAPVGASLTLLEVRIHTGRTHQVRVHLAHLGHPVAGDRLYGFRGLPDDPPIPRILLHARRLTLDHPIRGGRFAIEAPLPADFPQINWSCPQRVR
jgi:23S rRNA pseudouridine1911/1915/1917 synthase